MTSVCWAVPSGWLVWGAGELGLGFAADEPGRPPALPSLPSTPCPAALGGAGQGLVCSGLLQQAHRGPCPVLYPGWVPGSLGLGGPCPWQHACLCLQHLCLEPGRAPGGGVSLPRPPCAGPPGMGTRGAGPRACCGCVGSADRWAHIPLKYDASGFFVVCLPLR